MSQDDIIRLIGKLVYDKTEALKRQAAIDQELKLVGETIERAFRGISTGEDQQKVLAGLEPVRKFFSVDALRDLLEERGRLRECILDAIKRLRELGINQ